MLDKWSASAMVQTLVVTAVVAVGIKFIRWLLSCRAHFIFFNSLPGEREFSWIYGNLQKFRHMRTEERLRYLVDLTAKYPKFYRIWFGLRPLLDLHHPDSLRDLLKTAGPKPWSYDLFLPWLGEGLLISKGARWNRSRRLLTPAFHFDILKPYCNVKNRACDVLLEKLAKHAAEEKSIEMFGNISLCTFDIILQCAMSYTDDIQTRGESHPYVQAVSSISEMNVERSRNPLLYWDWVYALTSEGRKNRQLCDYVHSISDSVIKSRQQTLEKEGPPKKRYLDFLDVLLTARDSNGVGLTPLEIRAEVDTFMFEGHDTTASSLAWTLYALCEHPHYQKLVQQEIDTVLRGRQCDDITWDDLGKLEYLTLVIKEAMRLHCPVPFIARLLTEPLTIEGVSLPAGTTCLINIYNLHHNPELWPQPDVFDPDRFLPENSKDRDNYAFLPFSAGPRNCIGQHFSMDEQKVILGRLLRRFTFSLDPSHKVEKLEAAVMRTMNGMKMFAVPRTPTV